MTMGERIKALRLEYGFTQEALGEKLGIKKAAVQKYEKGTVKNIKRDTLISLADIFDTSVEYIVNGNESVLENAEPAHFDNVVLVPVLADVSAGMGSHLDNLSAYASGYETVDIDSLDPGEEYVYLHVKGDSMYPLFIEDDLILVRVQSSVDSGSYAVVLIDGESSVIKKVVYGKDYVELVSVNPMYPPRRFEGPDVERIRIFGIVKECKRKF